MKNVNNSKDRGFEVLSERDIFKEKFEPSELNLGEEVDDQELLRRAMEDVKPIRNGRRNAVPEPRKPPSLSTEDDDILPEEPLLAFMRGPELIESRHRPGYTEGGYRATDRRLMKKLRRGGFSVQVDLDLHGYTQKEARRELESFLRDCTLRGFSCVRIVHGKGLNSPNRESVLKKKVPEWLSQRRNGRYVAAFSSATIRDGGSGATYVLLRSGLQRAPRTEGRKPPPKKRLDE